MFLLSRIKMTIVQINEQLWFLLLCGGLPRGEERQQTTALTWHHELPAKIL